MTAFAESHVEEAALEWLGSLGYDILHGPDIGPDGPHAERLSYADVILLGVRRQMIWRNLVRRIEERWSRLLVDFMRRDCGVASADARWSVV